MLCSALLCCAGPVDGPAIFEGCTNCQVAVACHLFKANACANCEFGGCCWRCWLLDEGLVWGCGGGLLWVLWRGGVGGWGW